MGFYEPTEGRLLIDRTDLREFDLESYRRRVGLVSQDAFVFNGTILDNIAVGRPEATPEEVTQAARAAGLDEFIATLPERYETVIGERGANLSGGQRQRLAIARALLRKPDILIFDEATSHLDTATEQAVQQNLKAVLAGKTVVLVAHRLSTIKDANLIYVLHKGRIVEQGTHGQLLAREGYYWDLWRAQAGERAAPAPAGPVPAAAGSSATAPNTWYCAQGKQKVGPLTLEQLRQYAALGRLRPSDMILREGAQKWVRAGSLEGVFCHA
jgi:ABC-type multidrug transport system fused ATPase/permease subunit